MCEVRYLKILEQFKKNKLKKNMFNMSMLAVLLDAKQYWWMQVLKISTGFDNQTIKFDTISIFNFQDEISLFYLQ